MPTLKTLIVTAWISLLLAGCATGGKDTVLPQEGPTMKEVYDRHFGAGDNPAPAGEDKGRQAPVTEGIRQSRLRDNGVDVLSGYTRTAGTEIRNIFPRLKNKALIMYVFPHLSRGERNPVPGYSTAFSFYEKTEYALPGEKAEGY